MNILKNEWILASRKIPYSLISAEEQDGSSYLFDEYIEILGYYFDYRFGSDFSPEGTNGDYVPSDLSYKITNMLINKQARFLFAERPDITIEPKGDLTSISNEIEDAITILKDLVDTVLDSNNFEDILIKAAKDCFIGKRVACLINFSQDDGITINFLPSTSFVYEYDSISKKELSKFVAFIVVNESNQAKNKRIFKKKYEKINGKVYLSEQIYDGAGTLVEDRMNRQEILLNRIPAIVIKNDGLLEDIEGQSEVALLSNYESSYSKLNNADIDAERKSMNPIRFTVDMDSRSTSNLSSSPGSQWDLGTDQNLESSHPQVGQLESNMGYSQALQSTLDRIKNTAYEQIDMPNINLETMVGSVTSGKGLKAIYWPLIIRCKEKMKTWGPALRQMIEIIIEGSYLYPQIAAKHISDRMIDVAYEIKVEQVIPIQDDEVEEKNLDIIEVESNLMSKKAYMKKWRGLTDDEIEEELNQIRREKSIVEDSMVHTNEDYNIFE